MKIIDETRFRQLVEEEKIGEQHCEFLDSFKIGISIESNIYKAPEFIDLTKNRDLGDWSLIDITSITIKANSFYLAKSVQKLSLPNNIFGLLHTRSTIGRIGLDVLRGSQYVSPGFGLTELSALILELSPAVDVKIPCGIPLAGLLLFELPRKNLKIRSDHSSRFPFNFRIN